MYPAKDARELSVLLRISRELDVVGDVTATVDNPSELLAWALVLANSEVLAWRADYSGHRYIQVTAHRNRAPIRGCVTAMLHCDEHQAFWNALGLNQLAAGDRRPLNVEALSTAWEIMPITPPASDAGLNQTESPQPPPTSGNW